MSEEQEPFADTAAPVPPATKAVLLHQLVITCILNECEGKAATHRSIASLYAVLLPLTWGKTEGEWEGIHYAIAKRFGGSRALDRIKKMAWEIYSAAYAAITEVEQP